MTLQMVQFPRACTCSKQIAVFPQGWRGVFVALAVLLFAAANAAAAQAQSAQIWSVDASYPDNSGCVAATRACKTLQAAIQAAAAGDTLNVAAGTYSENIVVNKSLTLLGAQAGVKATGAVRAGGESILNGTGGSSSFVVHIQADSVTIDGFAINPRVNPVNAAQFARDAINVRIDHVAKPGDASIGAYRTHIVLRNNWIYSNIGALTGQQQGILFGESPFNNSPTAPLNAEVAHVTIADNYIQMVNTAASGGPRGIVLGNQFQGTLAGGAKASILYSNLTIDGNTIFASNIPLFQSQLQTRLTAITITHNTFGNSRSGVSLAASMVDSTFSDNTVQDVSAGSGATLCLVNSTAASNTFRRIGGSSGLVLAGGRSTDPTYFPASANATVRDNAFFYNDVAPAAGVTYFAGLNIQPNTDSAGVPIEGTTGVAANSVVLSGNVFTNAAASLALPAAAIVQRSANTTLVAVHTSPNVFDGLALTASSTVTELATLADRVADSVDAAGLGTVQLKPDLFLVTPASFWPPASSTAPSLQRAANAASPAATIQVLPGIYTGSVTLPRSVTLLGAGDGADPAAATILAVAAGNAGVTVAADHVHLQDLRIRRADAQYSAGIQITTTLAGLTLTRVSVLGAQTGLWVSTEGDVTGLAVTASHFDENEFGWYFQKASPNSSSVRQVQVTDTTFYTNTAKGFYAEKLDHALLDGIAVRGSGVDSTYGANQALGLDLRWGAYTDLTIQNSLFEASGAYGTASQPYLPAAVVLVARSELSGSLAGVTLTHNSLSGLENALRIGDLGHPGPQQVSVTQNRLLGANGAGTTGYGLVLASTAAVTAALNWWGDRTGPEEAANLLGAGSAITATSSGTPLYRPWLSSGDDSDPATTGFQPVFPQDRYGLLVGLTLPASALVPEFATATAHYTTTVQRTADQLVVTPTVAAGYAATVTVNGGAVAAGGASAILPLTVTLPTPISITVTGVDGWTQVYTLTAEIRCLDVVHVNRAATGPDKNGIGWASAWNDLQDALRSPRTCGGVSELWVASGVYTPGLTATATFSIPAGVALYGGFAATESTRDQRDWQHRRTVLSGDLAGDDRADAQGVVTSTSLLTGTNAYHVVWLEGTPSAPITGTTRLDGFVVTAGNASGGSSPHNRGGGLYCLSNGSPCSPALSNLFFSANRAAAFGGAVYLDGRAGGASSPTITHSEFRNNSAGSGGAMYNHGLEGSSSPALANTLFYANSANTGGAVYNNGSDGDSSPSFRQVTFAANSATTGGALYLLEAGSPQLTNTILWGNTASAGGAQLYLAAGAASPQPAIQFSIVQGGESGSNSGTAFSAGVGNLDRDPLFANRASGDLRLLAGSPAIDAGSNSGAPADDLRGLPRPVQAQVDIGAYETQGFTLTVSGGSGQSARIGQLFAEPLTVTLTSPTEPVGPGAVLTVTAPASGAGLAASSPYTVAGNSSGVGSTAVRANLLAGSYGVTVTARGVAVPAVFSLSNQPSPTAIQLAGAPPALYGAAVVLTATVTATLEGAGVPAGVVTFTAAAGALGAVPLNASGVATISTASLLAGTQRITATYGGSAHYLAIGPVTATQQVERVSPAIGLGSAPTPSSYGRTVLFTATVAGPGLLAPTGRVTFTTDLGAFYTATVGAGGIATATTPALPAGARILTASYSGDSNHLPGSSLPITQEVALATPGITLTRHPAASVSGEQVTVTATLSTTGSIAPAGTLTIALSSGRFLTTAVGTANSSLTMTLTDLAVGSTVFTATYSGDANSAAAVSAPIHHTVSQASTETLLESSPNPTTYGATALFTATVTAVAPGRGTPTGGTFLFTTPSGTLLGTSALNASGVATATLHSLPVGSTGVRATYSGDARFLASTSNTLLQEVGRASTETQLAEPAPPVLYGDVVTLTARVTATGLFTPAGQLTLSGVAGALVTATLDAGGAVTLTTASLPAGQQVLTATYVGNSNFLASHSLPVTQTVLPVTATTTLTVTPAALGYGQAALFTATVAGPGNLVPTGAVTLRADSGEALTVTLNAAGIATTTLAFLPQGRRVLTATYTGDPNHRAGESLPVALAVLPAATTTALASAPWPSFFGQPVIFTATVTTTLSGTGAPTGNVTFTLPSGPLGSSPLNTAGVATLTVASLPVGVSDVTAVYADNPNFQPSSSNTLSQQVVRSQTATLLASRLAASRYGDPAVLTATVAAVAPGAGTPGGVVLFSSSAGLLGAAPLDGSGLAVLTTTQLPAGSPTVIGFYAGDTHFQNSFSSGLLFTVAQARPSLTLEAAPAAFGQQTVLTATVSTTATGVSRPAGTVTFTTASRLLGTAAVAADGAAVLTTTALPLGESAVAATYGGDNNYLASTPVTATLTLLPGSAVVSITSTANPAVLGQSVVVTVSVQPPAAGAQQPTGTVSLTVENTPLAPVALAPSGVATFSLPSLTLGETLLAATYSGDGSYLAGNSEPFTQVVGGVSTAVLLSGEPLAAVYGTPVWLTATVAAIVAVPAGVLTPTGVVTFATDTTVLGSATLGETGEAVLATTHPPAGAQPITASYSGDAFYAASRSAVLAAQISQAQPEIELASPSTTSVYGAPVTLTVSVSGPGPLAPSGVVTLAATSGGLWSAPLDSLNVRQHSAAGATAVATLTVTSLPLGASGITATYVGDQNHLPADTAPVTLTVLAGSALIFVESSPNPAVLGAAAVATVTVQTPVAGGPAPSGSVTLTVGTENLAPVALGASGVATFSLPGLVLGQTVLVAAHSGDGTYLPGKSAPYTQTVMRAGTVVQLAVEPSAVVYGERVLLTATLNTLPPTAAQLPTGVITFATASAVLGSRLIGASGEVTLATTSLLAGLQAITATYGGDAFYAASDSGSQVVQVSQAESAVVLANRPLSTTYGQPVTLTVSVGGPGPLLPTGNITLTAANGRQWVAALAAGTGDAAVRVDDLPAGSSPLVALYGGDANHRPGSSLPITQEVALASTQVVLDSSPNPAGLAAAVNFTATVQEIRARQPAAAAPSGRVLFLVGSTAIGESPLVDGVARITTAALAGGVQEITALYSGDANYLPARSAARMQTILVPQPRAVGDAASVLQGETVAIPVLANDLNPAGGALTVVAVTAPASGAATLNQQTIRYTAAPAASGVVTFTYTLSDSNSQRSSATVVVFVRPLAETQPAVAAVDPTLSTTVAFTSSQGTLQVAAPVGFYTPTLAPGQTFVLSYSPAVTHTDNTQSPPGTLRFANFEFELDAFIDAEPLSDVQFAQPLVLTLRYDPGSVAALDVTTLALYYWDGTRWSTEGIQVTGHDVVNAVLTVSIRHLTQFALFGSSLQPEVRSLYLPTILWVGSPVEFPLSGSEPPGSDQVAPGTPAAALAETLYLPMVNQGGEP